MTAFPDAKEDNKHKQRSVEIAVKSSTNTTRFQETKITEDIAPVSFQNKQKDVENRVQKELYQRFVFEPFSDAILVDFDAILEPNRSKFCHNLLKCSSVGPPGRLLGTS